MDCVGARSADLNGGVYAHENNGSMTMVRVEVHSVSIPLRETVP